jgi:hypothetical protein
VFVQCQTSEGYSAALVVVLYTGKYLVAPAQCSSAASVSAGTHGMNEDL